LFLDGIRGWASIIVLLAHITVGLFAYTIPLYGKLKILSDGSFAVILFFVLSGTVLSFSHLKSREKVLESVLGRYFRLLIPIAISTFIAFILLKNNLFLNAAVGDAIDKVNPSLGNKQRFGNLFSVPPEFFTFIKFTFFDVFFYYKAPKSYNPPLWTMSHELIGSYLLYFYIYFFHTLKKTYIRASLITVIILLIKNTAGCFMLGYLAARIFNEFLWVKKYAIVRWISLSIFMVTFYVICFAKPTSSLIVSLLAFLMIISIGFSANLKKFFELNISQFLGKISFNLYLIHVPIMCSITSYFYLHFFVSAADKIIAANLIILLTILISVTFAYLLLPFEKFAIIISKKIAKKILLVFFKVWRPRHESNV